MQNYGAGDLLEVRLDGASVTELIPFTDAYVPVVDIAGGRVVVVMPGVQRTDDEDGDPRGAVRPASPLQQARQIARQAGGLADEKALQGRHAIDDAEPDLARRAQQRRVAGKQPVDAVEGRRRDG